MCSFHGFQFRLAFETKPLLVLRELYKMPEKGRPPTNVRQVHRNVFFAFEHPSRATSWREAIVKDVENLSGVYVA